MSGTEQIYRTLQNMDIQRLTKILSEAKTWIEQSCEQARDQLLDSPQLAYALYNIPDILEKKYQDMEQGIDSFGNQRYQNSQSTLYPNQYRNSQMQGAFYDFQSNNDNNANEQPEPEQIHHQPSQPIQPPPQTIPVQNYEPIPPAQPQNVYYPPQSNIYDPYQQPQYQYPTYGEPTAMQYQAQPQMSYSYGPIAQQDYAPTYEGGEGSEMEEFRKIALGLSQEDVDNLDKDLKEQVMQIRNEEFARQQQMKQQQDHH